RPQVVLREVARAPAYFPDLDERARPCDEPGADGRPIAPGPGQGESDPVVAVVKPVEQQARRLAHVQHEGVDGAVAVDVAEGRTPTGGQRQGAEPGRPTALRERAVAAVQVQEKRLPVVIALVRKVDLRHYVPARDQEVEPAVVVEVHEA